MAQCRKCDEAIVWAVTVAGKRIPLNVGTDPNGSYVCVEMMADSTMRVRALKKAERETPALFAGDEPRYMPHHATCPYRDSFRRRRV